jgi:tRNA nucleotidyltransferase (CCA-adding enzyme)
LEDALRRDLTINALFYNVHSRSVEDWTEMVRKRTFHGAVLILAQGLDDLFKSPLIRCPLPPFQTFFDDPLRILRCIRFASRFGFPLDPSIRREVQKPEIKVGHSEHRCVH